MTTKRFERDGEPTLVYDDLGDPGAPPVVLLHGGGAGNRKGWLDVSDQLVRAHRVLAPDLRGHGDSDRADGDYRIDHYASDIEDFLEEVAGGPVALVGHSLGGLVAAQIAGIRPELVQRAFFEDAPLHWEGGVQARGGRRYRRAAFRARLEELMDAGATAVELSTVALQEWVETGDFFRPRQELLLTQQERGVSVDEMVAAMLQTPSPLGGTLGDFVDPVMLRRAVTGLLASDPGIFTPGEGWLDAYDPRRPMSCPVHMLRADPSLGPPPIGAGFPPEAVDAFLATHPHATVELLPGVGHGIHFEAPDLFVERLEAFLDGHAETPEDRERTEARLR